MFFCGLLHMDTPVLADQQKLIFVISVQILDAVWRTCQDQKMIGMDGTRDAKKSMLSVQLNDDDAFCSASVSIRHFLRREGGGDYHKALVV